MVDLSIIIPTFNEGGNVRTMVERIRQVLERCQLSYEIWFIDDSQDDTPEILANVAAIYPEVHYVHRTDERGLGTAVVTGFKLSCGRCLVVMDSDLQHPPELLPMIWERLQEGIEVVIPSRFVPGGSDGGLSPFRKLVSFSARMIGRISLRRLRNISDCTGGYFGIHRHVIEQADLNPIGWKILMEVLVNGSYETVHEIPYEFVSRSVGESKMSLKEQFNYIRHVMQLVKNSPEDRRFYMFCFVGAMGVVVNLIVMSIMLHIVGASSLLSSVTASLIAMGHNFLWNDRVTWKEHRQPVMWRRVIRFPLFMLVSAIGIAVTALFAQCADWLNVPGELGQLVGIMVSTVWGFMANNRWTWNQRGDRGREKKVTVTQET